MTIRNLHGDEAIIEIVKSQGVTYTGGEADLSALSAGGVKLKATSSGVVEAKLAYSDSWELINIDIPNQYGDERIKAIREAGTTIPVANLRVGW